MIRKMLEHARNGEAVDLKNFGRAEEICSSRDPDVGVQFIWNGSSPVDRRVKVLRPPDV